MKRSANLQAELLPNDFADLSLFFCRAFLNASKHLILLTTVLFCIWLLHYHVDFIVLQKKNIGSPLSFFSVH